MSDTKGGVAIEVSEVERNELLEQVDEELKREDVTIAEVDAEMQKKKQKR
ncbi:hypothetical protein [Bacillus wiedmannii]|nr:hypothetical protein [Bacillus wiedmannii]